MYYGDIKIGQSITMPVPTTDGSGGSIDWGGTDPQIRVYKEDDLIERVESSAFDETFDGMSGVAMLTIPTTNAFYVPHADYHVFCEDGTVDSQTVNAYAGSFSIDNRQRGHVIAGSVTNTPSDGTTLVDSTKSATDDFYKNAILVFTSGTLQGIARRVSDYNGTTKLFTFDAAFPATPATGDRFEILGYKTS